MLQNRVVLVTGSSRGIGRVIAKRLAEEGATVVVNYHKSEKDAVSLAGEIRQEGGEVMLIKADVSNAKEVKNMVKRVVNRLGRIDVLVNNAAILIKSKFLDSTEQIWDKTIDVNLKGAYLCSKEVAPFMLKNKKGKIINISSTAGLPLPSALENTAYTVSKTGLIGLTRSLAINLAPAINVNAVCPGFIEAGMSLYLNTPEFNSMQIMETPLKRPGKPEEVADAVLFLASEKSDFITGEIITVSGGRGMR